MVCLDIRCEHMLIRPQSHRFFFKLVINKNVVLRLDSLLESKNLHGFKCGWANLISDPQRFHPFDNGEIL